MRLSSESEFLSDHNQGDAEHCTVGSDQRKKDSQSLIQGRADLLEHYLHHLYKSRDHKNERYGLQEPDPERVEHIILEQIGHKRGKSYHEAYGS